MTNPMTARAWQKTFLPWQLKPPPRRVCIFVEGLVMEWPQVIIGLLKNTTSLTV